MQRVNREQFEAIGAAWLNRTTEVAGEVAKCVASFVDRKVTTGELSESQAAACKAMAKKDIAETLATARQELADAADRLFGREQAESEATE